MQSQRSCASFRRWEIFPDFRGNTGNLALASYLNVDLIHGLIRRLSRVGMG